MFSINRKAANVAFSLILTFSVILNARSAFGQKNSKLVNKTSSQREAQIYLDGLRRKNELIPQKLIDAKFAEAVGDYTGAIDLCQDYLIGATNERFVCYASGEIGYCLAKTSEYANAMPYLSKYISYFSKVPGANSMHSGYLGRSLVYRGLCRAQLGDHQGAIVDLNRGINFIELRQKTDKEANGGYYEELGFAYFLRGCQKALRGGGSEKDGLCEDLRKAAELGEERANDLIAKMCN